MQAEPNILGIWTDYADLATDLNAKPDTVYRWEKKRRIPEDQWSLVIAAAARRGASIDATHILAFNTPMKQRGRPAHKMRRSRSRRPEARAS